MVESEEIFEAAQERVVIVRIVIAAWPYVLGNYQGASSTAARPVLPGATVLGPTGSLQHAVESEALILGDDNENMPGSG